MNASLRLFFLTAFLSGSAGAQEAAPMSGDEIVEAWGNLKYCRQAYRHPSNQRRVYEYDLNSCESAERYMKSLTMAFDPDSRRNLNQAAERRAQMIRSGTRDIAWVLNSCRDTCAELAAAGQAAEQP